MSALLTILGDLRVLLYLGWDYISVFTVWVRSHILRDCQDPKQGSFTWWSEPKSEPEATPRVRVKARAMSRTKPESEVMPRVKDGVSSQESWRGTRNNKQGAGGGTRSRDKAW